MASIYTGRIGNHYVHALNITVKSGSGLGKLFAPSWEMVCGHKAANGDRRFIGKFPLLNDAEYTHAYLELLRERYRQEADLFARIFEQDYVLCCYCPSGKFCHRLILVEQVLPKLALRIGIAYQYKGEI
jgi:hypothetical protein